MRNLIDSVQTVPWCMSPKHLSPVEIAAPLPTRLVTWQAPLEWLLEPLPAPGITQQRGPGPWPFQSIHKHFKSLDCMAPEPSLIRGSPTFAWCGTPRHFPSFMAACCYEVIFFFPNPSASQSTTNGWKINLIEPHTRYSQPMLAWHCNGFTFSYHDLVIIIRSTFHRGGNLIARLWTWAFFLWWNYCRIRRNGWLCVQRGMGAGGFVSLWREIVVQDRFLAWTRENPEPLLGWLI